MLHILNGDSLRAIFPEELEENTITWREILSEGPVKTRVDSEFWSLRANFLGAHTDYAEKVTGEWEAILQSEGDVTFWFEHDLVCQVNLIFLLAQLHLRAGLRERKVYLVCINHYPGIERFKGLAQLNPHDLIELYDNRAQLTVDDYEKALHTWNLYSGENAIAFSALVFDQPHNFKFLREAIVAHLEKFPSAQNGLSRLEQKMISYIDTGISDATKLERLMIETDNVYGLTDHGFKILLNTINPLLREETDLQLNELGNAILRDEKDFTGFRTGRLRLGGADGSAFRWDRVSKQLVSNVN